MKRLMPFLVLFVPMLGFFATVVACDGEREGHPAASPRYAPGVGWRFPSESYGSCDGPRVAEYGDARRAEQGNREAAAPTTNATGVKPKLQFEQGPRQRYVSVTGQGDEVVAFVERYQDALWPEWRKNKRAVEQMSRDLERARRSGKALVWVGDDRCKAAFTTACVPLHIDGIDDAD